MMTTVGLIILGLVFLAGGAEILVKGASRLAKIAGVSPLVVGLIVVAYGTSAPEMIVSIKGALSGRADIALGNVVGSNIFNVLFILGIASMIAPMIVSQQLIRADVPIMIGVSLAAIAMSSDGHVSRWEGLILVLGLIGYTLFVIRTSRKETNEEVKAEYAKEYGPNNSGQTGKAIVQTVWVVLGLALLVLGANWFVDGSISLARAVGVSELVIGLTIVAAGTSMPEVATSVMAAVRGERDIAVGNIVGSGIFNILGVLGVSALLAPNGVAVSPSLLNFDMPIMLAVSIACLPIFFTGNVIARWEGAVFFAYYVAYTAYLLLQSWEHDHLAFFSNTMLVFVIPITGLTFLILAYRQHDAKNRRTSR